MTNILSLASCIWMDWDFERTLLVYCCTNAALYLIYLSSSSCVARAPICVGTRAPGMSVAAVTRASLGPIVVRFGVSMACLGLAYFLSLTGLYVWVIEPIWSYLPLSSAISPIKFIFCCILVSALSGFISGRKPSHFYFTLCVLLIFVPSMTIYVCTDGSGLFLVMVLLAFAVLGLTLAIPPLSLPSVPMKLSSTGVAMVLLSLSAVILSAIALKSGIANFNLNPLAVYDFRDQANQTLQGGLAYFVPIATNVAIPLALVIGIARRLRLVVLLCSACPYSSSRSSHSNRMLSIRWSSPLRTSSCARLGRRA